MSLGTMLYVYCDGPNHPRGLNGERVAMPFLVKPDGNLTAELRAAGWWVGLSLGSVEHYCPPCDAVVRNPEG